MSRSVVLAARAKVNLTLEVLDRRDDGYHELRSVFALVDLADRVRVAPARALDVRISPPLDVARGEDLASRAVRTLAAREGRPPHAFVSIRKRIPLAAGLGGGSADAAATLRGLAELWRVAPADAALAAEIGSDVPFFASGAPFALVEGRGEHVRALPRPAEPLWLVLVLPRERLATRDVFAALSRRSDGTCSAELARAFADRTVTPAIVRSLATNDLRDAAERLVPALAALRERAAQRGIALHLSGSGPTLFAVAQDRRDALRIARTLRNVAPRVRVVRSDGT